jgi:hypothetical protein
MRGIVVVVSLIVLPGKAKFKKSHALNYPNEARSRKGVRETK